MITTWLSLVMFSSFPPTPALRNAVAALLSSQYHRAGASRRRHHAGAFASVMITTLSGVQQSSVSRRRVQSRGRRAWPGRCPTQSRRRRAQLHQRRSVAPTESPVALPPSLATPVSWVRAPCGDAHLSALRHRVGTIAAALLCSCGDESERQLP